MRIAFFVLLAVNLLYLAWASWVDTPAPIPVVSQSGPTLPKLLLAAEQSTTDQMQLSSPLSASNATAQGLATVSGGDGSDATSAARCVSVGPFNDLARAARAAALLRERGFAPEQRAEPGETWDGFWVYVGGLKSAAEEAKVVQTLERAGINDARATAEASDGRRVSVGLFSEKARAEKRAEAVQRLGFAAQVVERKQPGTVYWVDMDLRNERSVPTEGLLSSEDAGSRLEIRVCPSNAPPPVAPKSTPLPRDARPAATTADAGVPRPG